MWRVSKATISGINPSSELMMANAWNVSFKISLEKKIILKISKDWKSGQCKMQTADQG